MKRVANRYIKAVSRDGRLHDRTCERRRTQNETTKTFWLHSFDVDGRDGARDSLPVSRGREPLTSTTMMPIRILSRISSIDASIKKKKKKKNKERIAFVIHGWTLKSVITDSSRYLPSDIRSERRIFFWYWYWFPFLNGPVLKRNQFENYCIPCTSIVINHSLFKSFGNRINWNLSPSK